MNLADVRAELEYELEWRFEEIRFLRNQLSDIANLVNRDRHRRALVVILYSHFEGFWKTAFSIYVKTINREKLLCKDCADVLVAASLVDLLSALADGQKKHPFFRNQPADDLKLHQHYRHVEFLARLPDMQSSVLEIRVERVVDPESNLKPDVIRKNLYRLGFRHDCFVHHEGAVHRLLNRRNEIAHGVTRQGVEEDEYLSLEAAVLDIMSDIIKMLFDALRRKSHLRAVSLKSS